MIKAVNQNFGKCPLRFFGGDVQSKRNSSFPILHTMSRKQASVLLASLLLPLAGAGSTLAAVALFADVSASAWFTPFIEEAVALRIVGGYKDAQGNLTGKFGPADNVTLGQALKISVLSAGYVLSGGESGEFGWATPYVSVAMSQKFSMDFSGDLNRPATRAEVAQIVADAFMVNMETPVGNNYDDVRADTKHAFAIEALSRDRVVSGDTDASGRPLARFRPTANINRAEVTKIAMGARTIYGENKAGSSSVKPVTSSSSSKATSSPGVSVGITVGVTASGFSPVEITVKKGTVVTFKNDSTSPIWPASNPHPAHTDYPEFDANKSIGAGESFSFTFDRVGDWGFHNHLSSGSTGVVHVTE